MSLALPIASLALGAIGTGISAIGAMRSASATSAAANYRSQVAANNQQIANQYATTATQVGEANAEATSLAERQRMGALGAEQAASGIDVTSGSPVDVRATEAATGELNTLNTVQQAQQQAYGYRVQGVSQAAQVPLLQAQAQQARTAGIIGVAGSLIGGASNLGSKYLWMQQNAGSAPAYGP